MTHGEFDLFLIGTIIVCCVMAVFNALKNGHRGWPSMILSVAFLVFGGTVYLWRSAAAPILVDAGCALLILLICADAFMRAGSQTSRKKR